MFSKVSAGQMMAEVINTLADRIINQWDHNKVKKWLK